MFEGQWVKGLSMFWKRQKLCVTGMKGEARCAGGSPAVSDTNMYVQSSCKDYHYFS